MTLSKQIPVYNLGDLHRPEIIPKMQIMHRGVGGKNYEQAMPLGLEATQHFLALDHLLEQTLQKGPSPDHTESSLIMISIINVEKQGVQQRYPKTEKMISHWSDSKK